MSECGASLAGLRQADNISEKVRYRGSLITKRCDCRNSNGLDPVCKCTYKPPAPKSKVTRSQASVSAAAPPPRRIFTQTTQAPTPIFKSTAPRTGANLNGDTIPIPARYKYRKQFPAVPDPNRQLHWMVRPETPPRPARNPRNYHKYEEPVPHHRRTHMMPGTDENVVRSNLMTETAQPQQGAENTNNFHGPETKAGHFRAESSAPSDNPSQQAEYMAYRANRGYDRDQINNQSRQPHDTVRAEQPPQEHVRAQAPTALHSSQERAPVAHPAQEPVFPSVHETCQVQAQAPVSRPGQDTCPVQAQAPVSRPVQETCPVQAQAPVSRPVQETCQVQAQAPMCRSLQETCPVQAQAPMCRSLQETCQVQAQAPMCRSLQETCQVQAPVSHSMQEATTPLSSQAQVVAPPCVREPIQPSHPYHEAVPTSASVPVSVPTPRETAPMPVQGRPPTPMPGHSSFAQEFEAAGARESVAATKRSAGGSHAPHPQAVQRDLPPCPDRFYPCAHC